MADKLRSRIIDAVIANPFQVDQALLCSTSWVLYSDAEIPAVVLDFHSEGTVEIKSKNEISKMDWDLVGEELIISIFGHAAFRGKVYAYQNIFICLFTENNEAALIMVSVEKWKEIRLVLNN